MPKIKQLIESLSPNDCFFSYEFFPPKTQSGMQNLIPRLERMAKLGSLFITVTWGAGGSSSAKSLELAAICQRDMGIITCLHLTCTNMDRDILDAALRKAKELGIQNILALRGDAKSEEYSENDSAFTYAVDLIRYIRQNYGDYFCIGVAAYPEGHVDGTDESEQDPARDLPYLVEKVQAGADFMITQLFYDSQKFVDFEKMLREHTSGAFSGVPLIPGMMPINTYHSFLRAAKLSHASVPEDILHKIKSIPIGDDEAVKQLGVDILCDMISDIRRRTQVRGFHFYTLNLEKSVALIAERSGLLSKEDTESAIDDEDYPNNDILANGSHKARRRSSLATLNRVVIADEDHSKLASEHPTEAISEAEAASVQTGTPAPADILAISTGEGDLGREATWDDFPNGRFGDSRSPAYGEIDGYGPTLHVDGPKAYEMWGYPVDADDLSKLWSRHIRNEIEMLPFSSQGLSGETSIIQEELLNLIDRGFLTVASQPAANSLPSSDKIFGWGPPDGHIFQKAFVEFFISGAKWKRIKPILNFSGPVISYYEGNDHADQKFSTNLHPNSANAVTWGVFPNKEIVQSTILEEESFQAWRDEAFAIWRKWRSLYKPGTASHKLLDEVCNSWHLVSIVSHDYVNEYGLWAFLASL